LSGFNAGKKLASSNVRACLGFFSIVKLNHGCHCFGMQANCWWHSRMLQELVLTHDGVSAWSNEVGVSAVEHAVRDKLFVIAGFFVASGDEFGQKIHVQEVAMDCEG
jgi:hypothetical protein